MDKPFFVSKQSRGIDQLLPLVMTCLILQICLMIVFVSGRYWKTLGEGEEEEEDERGGKRESTAAEEVGKVTCIVFLIGKFVSQGRYIFIPRVHSV